MPTTPKTAADFVRLGELVARLRSTVEVLCTEGDGNSPDALLPLTELRREFLSVLVRISGLGSTPDNAPLHEHVLIGLLRDEVKRRNTLVAHGAVALGNLLYQAERKIHRIWSGSRRAGGWEPDGDDGEDLSKKSFNRRLTLLRRRPWFLRFQNRLQAALDDLAQTEPDRAALALGRSLASAWLLTCTSGDPWRLDEDFVREWRRGDLLDRILLAVHELSESIGNLVVLNLERLKQGGEKAWQDTFDDILWRLDPRDNSGHPYLSITANVLTKTVSRGNIARRLPEIPFAILKRLIDARGELLDRSNLQQAWPYSPISRATFDRMLARLRKDIRPFNLDLQNEAGNGWRLITRRRLPKK